MKRSLINIIHRKSIKKMCVWPFPTEEIENWAFIVCILLYVYVYVYHTLKSSWHFTYFQIEMPIFPILRMFILNPCGEKTKYFRASLKIALHNTLFSHDNYYSLLLLILFHLVGTLPIPQHAQLVKCSQYEESWTWAPVKDWCYHFFMSNSVLGTSN